MEIMRSLRHGLSSREPPEDSLEDTVQQQIGDRERSSCSHLCDKMQEQGR